MKTTTRLMLTACLVLPLLAACKKEEAPVAQVAAPLAAPTTADDAAWRTYVSDVVTRNMAGISNQPYVYYLPAATGDEATDTGNYERLQDKARTDVARGIVRGNMLAYASSDSAKMADIVVTAFADVPESTMQGVRVVFIGDAADQARVAEAVAPAGVEYVFVEAK
ncbi:hypothetical protein [Luteimonas granuli]|uniref:Uncharacterized protein n=1 Tax=Luteimonas granuli TaxID=1176533 RepID=A0A518N1M7_9GAMM|nr:hypothetical protein [Luteimonas granuli]QDW65808.1 hypothetical protein FPZ22_01930 [Luteimonas granuli]